MITTQAIDRGGDMVSEQVTLRELVRDPVYRTWIKTPPLGGFPQHARFKVYVQRTQGGPWAKKDFEDFKVAYNFLARHFKSWHDASLTCCNEESRPPIVRKDGKRQYHAPLLAYPGHIWCTYCRRPTIFGFYSTHHTFAARGMKPLPYRRRCGVCGIAADAIRRYR
jgi:hypothetical protein